MPPFRLTMHGRHYVSPRALRIDLRGLPPGAYRVVAVHNFHVEDRNPDLMECVAGVFLAARRADGRWEEPESFPVECRALMVLGRIRITAPETADA